MPAWEITFDPRLDLGDHELLRLLVQVEAHRQITNKIPLPPPVAARLNRLNLIRQIKGTTGIEGNTLTEDEISTLLDVAPDTDAQVVVAPTNRADLERTEVRNAARVASYIRQIARPGSDPIRVTEELIRELHRITTEGCYYENNVPGQYRQHRVHAGDYLPPDHADVPRLMHAFVEFINSREALAYGTAIRAIVAHFYLISIHPFGDGNGRTSRALEALLLYQGGYNVRGFYSPANFFYRRREEYIAALQAARFQHRGRLQEFVRFALRGFVEEIDRVQSEILAFVRVVMFQDYVTDLYRQDAINHRCYTFLTLLLESGSALNISVPEYRDRSHPLVDHLYKGIKSKRTVLRDLAVMKDLELISVTPDNRIRANVDVMNRFTE